MVKTTMTVQVNGDEPSTLSWPSTNSNPIHRHEKTGYQLLKNGFQNGFLTPGKLAPPLSPGHTTCHWLPYNQADCSISVLLIVFQTKAKQLQSLQLHFFWAS